MNGTKDSEDKKEPYPVAIVTVVVFVFVMLVEVFPVVKQLFESLAVRVDRALHIVLSEGPGGCEIEVALFAYMVHRGVLLVLP